MTYLYIFLGFAALIILHEGGHFAAAKAVGMRVERFSLFFGRTPLRVRRGETEYGIGWFPAGGFVKITGMSPVEAVPEKVLVEDAEQALAETRDELEAAIEAAHATESGSAAGGAPVAALADPRTEAQHRLDDARRREREQAQELARLQRDLDALEPRYYINQAPWKRIVVIAAGPAVNLVLAFLILFVIYMTAAQDTSKIKGTVVAGVEKGEPAASYLKYNDRLITIDGLNAKNPNNVVKAITAHKCAGKPTNGCVAKTPIKLTVRRHGKLHTFSIYPKYNVDAKRMLIGFEVGGIPVTATRGPGGAASQSISELWTATSTTVSKFAHIFKAKDRKQFHSVVGIVDIEHQEFSFDTAAAFGTIALISLSLAIVNLFPFLPLDGGHIFWAVAEKIRRRRIPFFVMERASIVGFLLIIMLFAIGMSNDISGLSNGSLHVPR